MTKQGHAPVLLRHSVIRSFGLPSSFVIGFSFVIYLGAPNFLAFRSARLIPHRGIKSASEVAKIDNGTTAR